MIRTRTGAALPALMSIALLVAGCAGGMASSGGGAAYDWPAGTAVTYDVVSSQVMTMEIPTMGAQTFTTTTTMEVAVEASGTPHQFKLTITDASMSSDAEAMGAPMPDIKALIGLESMVTLSERGLIQEATNLENNAAVNDQGGPEAFKEGLQALFLYMPEGGLGPGVQWTRTYGFEADQQDMKINFNFDDAYTCEERTTYEGIPAFMVKQRQMVELSGGGEQQGTAMEMDASGDGESIFYVEVGTGRILMVEGMASMTGEIYVEAAGMSIPVDIRVTATVKPKK